MLQSKYLAIGGFAGTLVLWLLSFIVFAYPMLHVFLVVVFLVGFTFLAFRSYSWALVIFFFELVIGNKGALFSVPVGDEVIGIRLALFVIVMFTWFVHARREKRIFVLQSTPYGMPWLLLILLFIGGALYGYFRDPSSLVYFDANGYIFYLALLPLTLVLFDRVWWKNFFPVLLGATTAIAILTIFISLSFTLFFDTGDFTAATSITEEQRIALRGETNEEGILAQTTTRSADKIYLDENEGGGMTAVYRWLRDTGNAEVSFVGSAFFRVFLSSHVFLFLAFLWLFVRVAQQEKMFAKGKRYLLVLLLLYGITMAVSFSRSLWLGIALAILFAVFLLSGRARVRAASAVGITGLVGVLVLVFLFPNVGQIFVDRFMSLLRPTQELAASTRLSLLEPIWERIQERPFFGWGFGTTVSFLAPVPGTEIVETIKVYLFEWSYLDLMVKTGIVGLCIFLFFLVAGFREALRAFRMQHNAETITLLAGILFLAVTHFTTPYLNHPLGIGALLILFSGALFITQHHDIAERHN
ncbi:MAG: O-antigen ligase family protein [Patescibacteria group bacterium]|jgi:hypothetical protein